MNAEMLHQFVDLKRDYEQAKVRVGLIKQDLDQLEAALLEEFASDGVANVKLDSGTVVYISTTTWARPKPGVDIVSTLRAAGHEELVVTTVNLQTLSAFVRETLQDGDLPPAIADAVVVSDVTNVRVRNK